MHVRISETLSSFTKKVYQSSYQVGSQEFFKACEVLWNKGILINIISTSRKVFTGKIFEVFVLDIVKAALSIKKNNPEMGKIGQQNQSTF